jgi:hypothetical protein
VILFVTPYIPDAEERDRTHTFLTALFAQLRVLGIELAVVITSMEHCGKVLGCCQHDMEVMLNNAGLGTESVIFLPRGNWTYASTPTYQAAIGYRKEMLEDTYLASAGTFLQPDDMENLVRMIRHKGYLWCTKYDKYRSSNTVVGFEGEGGGPLGSDFIFFQSGFVCKVICLVVPTLLLMFIRRQTQDKKTTPRQQRTATRNTRPRKTKRNKTTHDSIIQDKSC